MSTIVEKENESTTGLLGIERWVQFAFIGGALVSFWLLDHILFAGWELLADYVELDDPNETIVSGAAAVVAVVATLILYRRPTVLKFVKDCAAELARVTWPTRQETWAQTIVVVIVSVIAAVIIGVFDAVWSSVTDLIYRA